MKYLIIIFIFILSYSCLFSQDEEPFWEQLLQPNIGETYELVENSKGELFLASYNGVFVSRDNGYSWEQTLIGSSNKPLLTNRALTITVTSNDVIITLISGEIRSWSYFNFYRSLDDGRTWEALADTSSFPHSYSPHVLKSDGLGNVYYLTDGKSGEALVFYSTNNGDDWIKLNSIPEKSESGLRREFEGLEVDSSGNLIVAGHYNEYGEINYTTTFYSTDLGESWKELIINDDAKDQPGYVRSVRYFDEQKYIISTSNGLYLVDFQTEEWKDLRLSMGSVKDICFLSRNEWVALTYLPGAWLTTNSGKSWTRTTDNIDGITKYFNKKIYTFNKKDIFLLPAFHGIFRSSNKGYNWKRSSDGFSAARIYSIVFDKDSNMYISGAGVYKSTDNGNSFVSLHLDTINGQMYVTPKNTLLVSDSRTGLYRSTNGGFSWDNLRDDLTFPSGLIANFYDFVADSKGDIYAGVPFVGVYKSTDDGLSWEMMLKESDTLADFGHSVGINRYGHIFYGSINRKIMRLIDEDSLWEQVNYYDGSDISPVQDIYFFPNSDIGFATSFRWGSIAYRIMHKTTDNGATWKEDKVYKYTGLWPVGYFALDSAGNFWTGRLRTTDKGETWEQFDSGLYQDIVSAIGVSPEGYIFAAGLYGGLYRSRKPYLPSSVGESDYSNNTRIISTFPNPATETAEIRYYLTRPSNVKLKLFNSLGIEMVTVGDDYKDTGVHSQTIDVSGLSPGMYFFQLETEFGVETKKMVVVK